MKRDELPLVILDGRHAGELLAHPCRCTNPRCTCLGEHLYDSTRNMTPGPPAQAFEPRTTNPSTPTDDRDRPADPTATIHLEYQRLTRNYRDAGLALTRFITAHRPDRTIPIPEPATDNDWCRNHLTGIGTCEPRHRGDLCDWCYRVGLAHGTVPDRQFMLERREKGRTTPRMEADFLTRIRATRPTRKRRKVS